jgi:hypothetical protein
MIRAISIVFALACAFAPPCLAFADEGDACVLSYENAQVAKKKHDMVGAKEEITLCEHACPTALAKDCEAWLPEVQAGIGKLVVSIKRRDGSKPETVRVFVDEVETPIGDGTLEENLGQHTLRVESPAMKTASVTIAVPAGVPASISVVLEPLPSDQVGGPAKPGLPAYPFVVGGIGLGVVAVGGGLGIAGQVDVANMRATCAKTKPLCSAQRVDVVRKEWIAGGVLAGIGGLTVAIAGLLLATDRPKDTSHATTFVPAIEVDRQGFVGGFAARF